MHVHGTQMNPYAALDALRSAQRAEAKREAELVRKELMESASELAGKSDLSDACMIKVADREEEDRKEARQESQRQPRRQNQQKEQNRQNQEEPTDSEEDDQHHSDWA
jgi:hypothetical protein